MKLRNHRNGSLTFVAGAYIEETERGVAIHDGNHHQNTHTGDQARISPRHNNNNFTNVLFYDGHASTFLRAIVVAGSNQDGDFENPVIFKSARKRW